MYICVYVKLYDMRQLLNHLRFEEEREWETKKLEKNHDDVDDDDETEGPQVLYYNNNKYILKKEGNNCF